LQDKKADLIIHTYVDRVMESLLKHLELDEKPFNLSEDPTKKAADKLVSWDFPKSIMSNTKRMYLDLCTKRGKRPVGGSKSNEGGGMVAKKQKDSDSEKEKCQIDSITVKKETEIVNSDILKGVVACNTLKEELFEPTENNDVKVGDNA